MVNSQEDDLVSRLKSRLQQPEAREGTRLPPERELAKEMQVGRRALRNALARLEAEGLIWRRPGIGTVIAKSVSEDSFGDVRKITSPTDLMEARLVLEPAIAALAAVHATSHDIDEMYHYLEKSAAVTDHKAWERWDGALHSAIGRATHNKLIERLFELLTAARSHTSWGKLRKSSLTPERREAYTKQHRELVRAIENRDVDGAARLMQEHLNTIKSSLLNPWEPYMGNPISNEENKKKDLN